MVVVNLEGITWSVLGKGKFLKWQPCHFLVMAICFVYGNLPTVLLMFSINLPAVLSLISNHNFLFIVDGLALALNSLGLLT